MIYAIKPASTYTDLVPTKEKISRLSQQAYESKKFYKDFLVTFAEYAPRLGIQRFTGLFEKLFEKGKIVVFFTKRPPEELTYGAYYNSASNILFVPYTTFYQGTYTVNFVKALSVIVHELAHMVYANKPFLTINTFKDLLRVFYKYSITLWIKSQNIVVNQELRDDIDEMAERFFITADAGLATVLMANLEDFYKEKGFPREVRKSVDDLLNILFIIRSGKALKENHKRLIWILIKTHSMISGVDVKTYFKADAGIPYQEFYFPSEIISLQSQVNQAVRVKVLGIVNRIV